MPSSPESEGTKDDNSVTTGFISPDDLPGQKNVRGPTRSPSTSIPQLESGHNKPQVINAPQRAVVEQRASLFGPTAVKGCRSVESLRKRVARMPSLDSLPENGTERACPEIEIEGMNQGIPDEEHSAMLLVIPEISRIVEPLSMPELEHMSIMLHQRYGRVETPTDEISNAERLKTVVRKKGFEVTGFKLDEKENKISLSLLKKEFSVITNTTPSSPHQELVTSSKQPQAPVAPSTRLLQARSAPQQRSFGPRLRNAITMSNLRAKARENEVSTPLYPSQRRPLRPSASNGALLSSRPTIRAVQPSPVISESPGRFSPHKNIGVLTRGTNFNRRGEPFPEMQIRNQLTENNLRIQERLGPLSLREGSEAEINLQRAQALDRTLKFGEELLQKIDKDNAQDRAQLMEQAGTLETTNSSTTDNSHVAYPEIVGLANRDILQYAEEETFSGLSCTGSRVSRSHVSNTASVPRLEVPTMENQPTEEDTLVARHPLRLVSSMADMRSRNKETVAKPFSRAAVEPGLTPYRSFSALPAATNLVTKETRARTPFDPTRKNAALSRPTTSQSNKQKDQPAGAKKTPGGFGRELKWA
ncbi:uncharacterized protein H6S33_010862 [Morchella sextelata]|uniref:uncharacterized protein n=1 Tax=Morchella sextelata TaxID=1174677 RepID=UPI001D051D5F|nr:uncharacterized protein H6S33_010862 [Morchella sextelata]KAH0611597.1 hypothetical protein H6S33_010862 [Morchella sextelata]